MNNELIAAYSDHQRAGSLSDKTIIRRAATLRTFGRYVTDLTTADEADVIAWLNTYRSPKTKHAYRSDLMGFYDWLAKRGRIAVNPVADTRAIKLPTPMPRPIGPEVAVALQRGRKRTRQMVALGLYAGLRCAEIAALDGSDLFLHLEPPILLVRDGKGGKDRAVPMHPELVGILDDVPPAGPVFPGQRGREHVSAASVSALLSRHLRACGIKATPHQLRHTFGTEMTREANGDLLSVAVVMGHASMQTTRGYAGWAGAGADIIGRMYRPPLPPAA